MTSSTGLAWLAGLAVLTASAGLTAPTGLAGLAGPAGLTAREIEGAWALILCGVAVAAWRLLHTARKGL